MAEVTKVGSVFVNDATVGTEAWANPGNVVVSLDLYATFDGGNNDISEYLKSTGYGFSIPVGNSIDGIEVKIERKGSSANRLLDNSVRLVKGGAISGDDKATGTSYPTDDTVATYGGPTDLWGLTWDAADINASDFGNVLSSKRTSGGGMHTASVDHITITVHHSAMDVSPSTRPAGTGADSGGGDEPWSFEEQIDSSDNQYALVTLGVDEDAQTNYLEASEFDYNLPAGAVIDGIEVTLETSKFNASPDFIASSVFIMKAGANAGTEKTPSNLFDNTSDTTVTLGGSSDLWGTTWTQADINSAGFGASVRAIRDSTVGDNVPRVDFISTTVYFNGTAQRRRLMMA